MSTSLVFQIQAFLWGTLTNHPNVKESQLGFVSPVVVRWNNLPAGCWLTISIHRPQLQLLNAFELEQDFVTRMYQDEQKNSDAGRNGIAVNFFTKN